MNGEPDARLCAGLQAAMVDGAPPLVAVQEF